MAKCYLPNAASGSFSFQKCCLERVEVGVKWVVRLRGLFQRLPELLGMQTFLRRLLLNWKMEISKDFLFQGMTLPGCYMGVNGG